MTMNVADVVGSVSDAKEPITEHSKKIIFPPREFITVTPAVVAAAVEEAAASEYRKRFGKDKVLNGEVKTKIVLDFLDNENELFGGNTPLEYMRKYPNGCFDVLTVVINNPKLVTY